VTLVKYLIVIGGLLVLMTYVINFYYANDVLTTVREASRAERVGRHEHSRIVLQKIKNAYGKSAVDFLIDIVHDKKLQSLDRQLAQQLLEKYKDEYGKGITIDTTTRRVLAALEFDCRLDTSSLGYERCIAYIESTDGVVRASAVERLGVLGKQDAVKHIRPLLEDEYWLVRLCAIDALLLLKADSAAEQLLVLCGDPVQKVRWASIRAVGILGKGDQVYKRLVDLLEQDFVPASDALATFGDTRAVAVLTSHLDSAVHERRIEAAKALLVLDDERGIGFLLDEMRNGAEDARARAAAALGTVKQELVVTALREAIGDRSPKVRCAAALALGRHRGPEVSAALKAGLTDKDVDVVAACIRSMGHSQDARLIALVRHYLGHAEWRLLSAAIDAVVTSDDEASVDLLEKLLETEFAPARIKAWRALKRLTGREYEFGD